MMVLLVYHFMIIMEHVTAQCVIENKSLELHVLGSSFLCGVRESAIVKVFYFTPLVFIRTYALSDLLCRNSIFSRQRTTCMSP